MTIRLVNSSPETGIMLKSDSQRRWRQGEIEEIGAFGFLDLTADAD